jgi:hypothetical protein
MTEGTPVLCVCPAEPGLAAPRRAGPCPACLALPGPALPGPAMPALPSLSLPPDLRTIRRPAASPPAEADGGPGR